MDCYYGMVLFLCCWISGFGKIPAPTNVTMDSVNFRNLLRWNQSAGLEGDVIYTVQYKLDVESNRVDYQTVCITREQQCDSSVIEYKSYVRVNAQLHANESEWVTIHFDPYNQTIIGPPKLRVSSRSGYLDISIKGPVSGVDEQTLKDKYGDFVYKVEYWKESDPANVLLIKPKLSTDILHDLETWTVYCVKVQAYMPEYDKSGDFSPVICEQTTEEVIPSWKIAVLFLGAIVLAAVFSLLLTFIASKAYKSIQYVFFPPCSFPEHLKEYLSKPFYNPPHLSPQPTEECGESCEQLTFVSEETEEKDAS
ncbi:hypothetical protein PRIEUP_LOCUS11912 [Pristimantis euphronides]